MSNDYERIVKGMKARGFQLEGTGGGCDAFVRYEEQDGVTIASVYVTRECDPSVPDDMDEPIDVGYYAGAEADTNVMMMRFPSVWAFFNVTQVQAENLAYRAEKYGSAE